MGMVGQLLLKIHSKGRTVDATTLQGSHYQSKTLIWDDRIVNAFQVTWKVLEEATLLTHSHHNATTSISGDASDVAVGVVIKQHIDGR